MTRTVKEWIGKTPDQDPPPRVRDRVLAKSGHACAKCTRPITTGMAWICDHVIAIINGGENREKNLQPLCNWCNPEKNAADVAEKSKVYKKRTAHYGTAKRTKKTRRGYRPMPGGKNSPIKITIGRGPVLRATGEPVRRRT